MLAQPGTALLEPDGTLADCLHGELCGPLEAAYDELRPSSEEREDTHTNGPTLPSHPLAQPAKSLETHPKMLVPDPTLSTPAGVPELEGICTNPQD